MIENPVQLDSKVEKKIINEAIMRHLRREELKPYQGELIKLQNHMEYRKKQMIILFDGRDASGKGGTIRRVVRYMNEKHYRVIALGKPTPNQKTELHMKRYIEHFPHAGEIVLFDRSWYNRAMVEPIFDFCTQKQYRKFLESVNSYEENFLSDGNTILLKLYFSVSKRQQEYRFNRRKNDTLRQWKLSEVDLQAQELWDEFTKKKFKMLKATSTEAAPWTIIRSDNKHLARRETMKVILNSIPYRGRSRKLDFNIDPRIVIPADQEIRIMKRQKRKYGKYIF